MENSTEQAKRSKTVQTLMSKGFRLQYSNSLMTVLCRPTSSTMLIAQVDNEGNVNTGTLSDFLETILE